MKKNILIILLLTIALFGCETQDDNAVPQDLRINDFVWKGMNLYYLWQEDVPLLHDERFENQQDLNRFLAGYNDPVELFNDLRVDPSIDRFSIITRDYRELEGILSGTTKNNGVDYGLRYKPGSETEIFGWVRYILPNSDASSKDIQRGDIFYAVDGTPLTIDNYQTLLAQDTYTLNLANFDNGNITPNGESVTLTKNVYSENPVLIADVLEVGQHRIGYLMYNGFYPNYDDEVNTAIGQLESQGITDFVLDLRYNSGGSIASATRLASMLTGQFTGQIFAKEQWNDKLQEYYEDINPQNLRNNFTDRLSENTPLNTLNLTTIYILTSRSTASSSELVINGLEPYINVIQVGDLTTGKNVGSVTLYDSPSFGRSDRNPYHFYAMQPIVLKVVNAAGFGDYLTGLQPDYPLVENLGNLQPLGTTEDPLLSTAIGLITADGRMLRQNPTKTFKHVSDSKTLNRMENDMYRESLPMSK
jgi:C-terminal processing protease CtpA/Prc